MRHLAQFTLLFALVLLIAGCGEKKDVVARVGRESVTLEQFKDSFMARYRSEDNAKQRTFQERKEFVRDLALTLAKYQEGVARGYDKDPELASQLESVARKLSLDYLYRDKVTNAVITDEMIRHAYEMGAKEIRARHILLKSMPGDTTDAADARLKGRIDSIRTLIVGGMDFGEAAIKFSQDQTTAPDSGDLEWFPWGRMVDEFQEAAWAAKIGELVGPVRTPYGYHLIMVTETREVTGRPPFDEMRDQMRMQLSNQYGERLGERAKEFVESMRSENNLKYNDETLEMFRQRLLDPTVPKNQELGPMFTGEQKEKVAATYKGGEVTVADLIEKVGNNAHRVDWNDATITKDLVNSLIEPKLLEAVAEREGLYKQALQDKSYLDQMKNAVIRNLEKTEITDKVAPTAEDEKAYYETHLDQFIQPERRTICEIFIKDDSVKAVRVRDRALKGENFERLALQFNEKESTKPDTGRLGPFEQKRFGVIGKTAFRLEKVGDISEVVAIGKNFSVVQLLDILPSRTQSWEEAQADAKREYRVVETSKRTEELEKMLLEKYKLEIFEDKLAAVWPLQEEEKLVREP